VEDEQEVRVQASQPAESEAAAARKEPESVLQSKLLVAFVAALGAAIAPATAYITKGQEIELTRAKQVYEALAQDKAQMHKVRMDFLEKVVSFERDKKGDSYYRRDVLEFFARTLEKDSPLQAWAQDELTRAQKEVAEIEKLRDELKQANAGMDALRLDVAKRQAQVDKQEKELSAARKYPAQAAALQAAKAKSEAEARGAAERLQQQEERVRLLEARDADFRTLATTNNPCPAGTTLQSNHGSSPKSLAACIRAAPSSVSKNSMWSVDEIDLNCACR
jgi:hypothetical protein